jgi:pimeloyl-ACP methyl ester carboxylesterase
MAKSIVSRIVRFAFMLFTAIISLIVIAFITILISSPGKVSPTWDNSTGFAEKVYLDIGGVKQGMILESKDIKNPVLLILHGGPGSTEYANFKHYDVGLEDLFTVCYWEQRGSGMSFNVGIDPDTMTLNQLILDTVEVTNYLRGRFGKERIYILGHSWGTFLGSHVVNQYPELYHAYMGVGQVNNTVESEKEIYKFMYSNAEKTNDKKALKELSSLNIHDDNTYKNGDYLGMRTKYVIKYGGGLIHKETSMIPFVRQLVFCKAYTIKEKMNFIKGSSFSGMLLLNYIADANLLAEIPVYQIPVYIFAGKYDYQTTCKQAQLYYQAIDAPAKSFYLFENSAHSPMFEETQLFIEIINTEIWQLD